MDNLNTKKAFTLSELIVAFTVISLIGVMTIGSFALSMRRQKSIVKISSCDFYGVTSSIYTKITSPHSNTYFNPTADGSEDLLNDILRYIDYVRPDISCADRVNFDAFEGEYCAELTSGILLGVTINNDCDSELDVYEYLQEEDKDKNVDEIETRSVSGACGYILYRTKNSSGIYKQDAFVIPLGKRRFK